MAVSVLRRSMFALKQVSFVTESSAYSLTGPQEATSLLQELLYSVPQARRMLLRH